MVDNNNNELDRYEDKEENSDPIIGKVFFFKI